MLRAATTYIQCQTDPFDRTHVLRIPRFHVSGTESLSHERDIDATVTEHCEARIHLSLHGLLILGLLGRELLLLLLLSLQMLLLLLMLLLLQELLLVGVRELLLRLLLLESQASSLFSLQLQCLRGRRHLALHGTGARLGIARLTRLHLLLERCGRTTDRPVGVPCRQHLLLLHLLCSKVRRRRRLSSLLLRISLMLLHVLDRTRRVELPILLNALCSDR